LGEATLALHPRLRHVRGMSDPLTRVRAICTKLPGVTESPHHGRIAFKANGKLFATAGAGIVALAPDAERREALLASGIAAPYPRDKRAIEIDVTGKVDWKLIEQCVFDSYASVAETKKPPKRTVAPTKPSAKKH
jgi:hypothetical protein